MKRLLAVSGSLITLLLFVIVGFLLIRLLQSQSTLDIAQKFGPASSPTPTQTPTSTLTWETATLDQIHLGEPKVVFTHNDAIRIYDWLPDNQRLLLEIADPTKTDVEELTERYRIVTLDVETGQIVDYGRRPSRDVPPVWIEAVQGVAYDFYDHWRNKPPEIRLGLGKNQINTIVQANAYVDVDPKTGNLFYLERMKSGDALYSVDTKEGKIAPVSTVQNLPGGQLRIDSTGRWLVSFLGRMSKKPLYLVDRSKGTVTEVSFGHWWPIDVAWSPEGDKLALILAIETGSQLAIFDPETTKWEFVNLPVRLVTEIDWAPKRYLLVKGISTTETSNYHEFWLVDTFNGDFQETKYFTPTMVTDNVFWAWSDNGDIAWLDGDQMILTHSTFKEEK